MNVEGNQTSDALVQNLNYFEGDLMNLKSHTSSWIWKRVASLLGTLVLSSVLLPIAPATAATLAPARIPTFSTPVSTAVGFTVNVTNYDLAYTFTPSTSAGSVLVSSIRDHTLRLTVSALAFGTSATVTVTTARTGYGVGTATVTGSALLAPLTPTFSTPVPTANGFTVNVTNYDPGYKFTQRTSAGHLAAGVASGTTLPLTITQLTSKSSATITVSTSRNGYVAGRATATGTKLPNTGLIPTFSTPVSTATGFTVNVTNYNSAYTFTPTSSTGTVVVGEKHDRNLRLTVSALAPGASAVVTVTTIRTGFGVGTATVTGSALLAALTPTFSTPVSTATGFTVNVTNYDSAYKFSPKASAGHVNAGVASSNTLTLTVQLDSRSSATITVTVTRPGYVTGHATVTGSKLPSAALIPTFSTPVSTATGFTVNVTNYNSAYTFTPTSSAGSVVVGKKHDHNLALTVTGLAAGTSSTLTVATARNGYVGGSSVITGTALLAALIPTFSTPVSTATGFTVNVTNYDSAYKFAAKTSQGHVVVGVATGTTLPLTVQVTSRSTITVSVTATRIGYAAGNATVTGIKGPRAALIPTFSKPVSKATGFTVNVTNYNPAFTFTPASSAGKVTVGKKHDHTLALVVTGLTPGAAATLTVTTTRTDYGAGVATVTGSALLAALKPTFSTPVSTATGFTVNVTNYDAAFTFSSTASKGHVVTGVASGAILPLTVTGVTSKSSFSITVKTKRVGYVTGRATVTGKVL